LVTAPQSITIIGTELLRANIVNVGFLVNSSIYHRNLS
jgi:hypothetical protein